MKLAICVPLTWPFVHRGFCESIAALFTPGRVAALEELGVTDYVWLWNHKMPIDANRNELARTALEYKADYLLWLDADMTFPPDLAPTLVRDSQASNGGIVSAVYHKHGPPFVCVSSTVMVEKTYVHPGIASYYRNIDPTAVEGLLETHLIGMGAVVTPAAVFRKIPHPWFRYAHSPDTSDYDVSEDVYFCEKARYHGFEIFTDCDVRCGHITAFTIDTGHWQEARDQMAPQGKKDGTEPEPDPA